jgi:ribosomal protein S18
MLQQCPHSFSANIFLDVHKFNTENINSAINYFLQETILNFFISVTGKILSNRNVENSAVYCMKNFTY